MIDWFYTSEMQSCRYTRYWTPQTSILHNNLCLSMICSDNGVEKFCWYCLICYVHMNLCTRLTAASDKVYQLLAHGRCFSPVTPASSTTKTCRHDIHVVEILLKVALSTINQIKSNQITYISCSPITDLIIYITRSIFTVHVLKTTRHSIMYVILIILFDFYGCSSIKMRK